MAILWNTTTDKIGVLPGAVPRLAALVMLLAAAAANVYGEQSFALASATIAAAICLGGTSVSRWAAAPLIGIAAAGLLAVFSSYVRSGDVTWHVSLAMAGYALTMICALMILVDRGAERCELL